MRHGGRLQATMAAYPHAPRPWLDLSTGINPEAYPAPGVLRASRARLPDPADLRALEAAAAKAFGVDPERVCATAGAESGLRLLPIVLGLDRATILGPTYAGHAEAWRAAGATVDATAWPPILDGPGAVVLVNPNNPDGRAITAARLRAFASGLPAGGRWLIVDESFVETDPALSVAPQAGDRLIVLRSFGKFYGLAGLRLGFVLGDPAILERIRALQGDWPLGADAIAAGLKAYPDTAWAGRSRRRLARSAARLDALLTQAGWSVVGGTSLFRLARAVDARRRFERLCKAGVLTRPFADAPDHLRFGLPARQDWRRLEAALIDSAA